MDAGRFYALLRFEEASLALRATLRFQLVDRLGEQRWTTDEICRDFGFTRQATRTFFALLQVMDVVDFVDDRYVATEAAKVCLTGGTPTSRSPYLSLGAAEDVDELIDLLQGKLADDALPLYGGDDERTVMDVPEVAREISFGLASRARNFASTLARAISKHVPAARVMADIGAGSPYVSAACLNAMPNLEEAILVDRPNGMKFAKEMMRLEQIDDPRIGICEQDFFATVPRADAYCISNTAHDWDVDRYKQLIKNVRGSISADGVVCLHEPLLRKAWANPDEWITALWMACYALTLFRLTVGQGTCYTLAEHDEVMESCGFARVAEPINTSDGCTAMFYH